MGHFMMSGSDFFEMYKKNLISRDQRIVDYDPEMTSFYLKYKEDSDDKKKEK